MNWQGRRQRTREAMEDGQWTLRRAQGQVVVRLHAQTLGREMDRRTWWPAQAHGWSCHRCIRAPVPLRAGDRRGKGEGGGRSHVCLHAQTPLCRLSNKFAPVPLALLHIPTGWATQYTHSLTA